MTKTGSMAASVERHYQRRHMRLLAAGQRGRWLRCAELGYGPDPALVEARVTGLSVNLVLAGRAQFVDRAGARHPLGPGDVFGRQRGRGPLLALDADSGYRECYCVTDMWTAAALESLAIVPRLGRPCHDQSGLVATAMQEVLRLTADDGGDELLLLFAFQELLRQVRRIESTADDLCEQVRREMERQLGSREPLAQLAARFGLSYDQLHYRFVQAYGCTPNRYRIEARIRRAVQLLPRQSVQEVAALLGYSDPFVFSRQFKQVMGRAPSRFHSELDLQPRRPPA